MIEIHRKKRVMHVGGRLSKSEYPLMVLLGTMGNRLVSHDLLLDAMCGGRTQIPEDRPVLWSRMSRLRGKLGNECLVGKRGLGYRLAGDVKFVG